MKESLIGKTFTRLFVESEAEPRVYENGRKRRYYNCICSCGEHLTVSRDSLLAGKQKSCGCLRRENGVIKHGEIGTRLYRIWANMVNRCNNEHNPRWPDYGGRGIGVYESWMDYINFRNWALQNGYEDTLTIDRIDNNGNYSPDNCRWVDDFVQANNKRNNHLVTYRGETKTLSEWAEVLGFPYKTLHHRFSLGWSVERALSQPLRKSPTKHSQPNT